LKQKPFDLKFEGVDYLKGVLNGEKYPIIGIDTERDTGRQKLSTLEKGLSGTIEADATSLSKYLEEFLKFHEIEKPNLKIAVTDRKRNDPQFYLKTFKGEWDEQLRREIKDNKQLDDSVVESGNGEEVDVSAIKELEKKFLD
jgi:hypothetical protein